MKEKQAIAYWARPFMTKTARIAHVKQHVEHCVSEGFLASGMRSTVNEIAPHVNGEAMLRQFEWTFCYQ